MQRKETAAHSHSGSAWCSLHCRQQENAGVDWNTGEEGGKPLELTTVHHSCDGRSVSKEFHKSMCSLMLSLVPQHYLGAPHWYVSHAWGGSFCDLVEGLVCELAPEPLPTEPALPPGFKDGIFLWIGERVTGDMEVNELTVQPLTAVHSRYRYLLPDIFAVDLHNHSSAPSAAAASALAAMSLCKGLVMAVDQSMMALSRIWCLWEVFQASYRKGEANVRLVGDISSTL